WTNSPVWTEFKNPELLACADGTWGAEFHSGLEPRPGEMVVAKHRYSAFIGTDLDMLLRARGVKSLLVTGVGTGLCVFHTLTVGFMLDYYITLVEDCCATTYGPEAHHEAVALVKKHYGRVAAAGEIIDIWKRHARAAAPRALREKSFFQRAGFLLRPEAIRAGDLLALCRTPGRLITDQFQMIEAGGSLA